MSNISIRGTSNLEFLLYTNPDVLSREELLEEIMRLQCEVREQETEFEDRVSRLFADWERLAEEYDDLSMISNSRAGHIASLEDQVADLEDRVSDLQDQLDAAGG